MTTRLVIVGCGGFGREVFEIALACRLAGQEIEVLGFVDDAPTDHALRALRRLDAAYLGPVTSSDSKKLDRSFVVAIGSPEVRRSLVSRLGPEARFASLVHPASTLGRQITLGDGCIVAPGVRLSTNIHVGNHVHFDQNVTVGHDGVVGDFARLNPASCVSGSVTIGESALVGANATVLQGLTIGVNAVVGAGAVVTRDVGMDAVVRGVPAR